MVAELAVTHETVKKSLEWIDNFTWRYTGTAHPQTILRVSISLWYMKIRNVSLAWLLYELCWLNPFLSQYYELWLYGDVTISSRNILRHSFFPNGTRIQNLHCQLYIILIYLATRTIYENHQSTINHFVKSALSEECSVVQSVSW